MTWEVASREGQGLGLVLRKERMPPRAAYLKGARNCISVITMKIQETDVLLYGMRDGGASSEHLLCALGAPCP